MQKLSSKEIKNGDLFYFGGLIDGEAYIGMLRSKRSDRDGSIRFVPRVIVSMLKKDVNVKVLRVLHETFGGSIFTRKPFEYKDRVRVTHKEQIAVEFRYVQALNLLKVMQPFLRIKQKQANLILSCNFRPRYRVTDVEQKYREKIYEYIKTINDGRGKKL